MPDKASIIAYRDYLIKNGLNPAIAEEIAFKTNPSQLPDAATASGAHEIVASRELCAPEEKPEKASNAVIDFRSPHAVPDWVRDVIEAQLAIDTEDAKKAGTLGFMARALVIATMPYKDQKNPDGTPKESFTRQNGDFKLRIVAGYDGGIPFGIYPRLLMSWVTTEAVKNQSPIIELGESLRAFLRDVLDLRSSSGGKRGTATRVNEQMKRLFGSLITAQYATNDKKFTLKNVLIADSFELNEDEDAALWTPQSKGEAGAWQSKVKLTNNFFQECVTRPVPIDLRAYKALRGSPLAMDIYTWLTYRMSYVESKTRPISWESLMMQFGSGYGLASSNPSSVRQAVADFKRAFLKALKSVLIVYPEATVEAGSSGLILYKSPTHIQMEAPRKRETKQGKLF